MLLHSPLKWQHTGDICLRTTGKKKGQSVIQMTINTEYRLSHNCIRTWISCGIILFRRRALILNRATACSFTSWRRFTSRRIHLLTYRLRTCNACHGGDMCEAMLTGGSTPCIKTVTYVMEYRRWWKTHHKIKYSSDIKHQLTFILLECIYQHWKMCALHIMKLAFNPRLSHKREKPKLMHISTKSTIYISGYVTRTQNSTSECTTSNMQSIAERGSTTDAKYRNHGFATFNDYIACFYYV